jgi:hypothetical protein
MNNVEYGSDVATGRIMDRLASIGVVVNTMTAFAQRRDTGQLRNVTRQREGDLVFGTRT